MAFALAKLSASTSAAVATAPTAAATSAAPPRFGLVVAVLEQARGGLRANNACDLCRAVFLGLLDGKSVLHFPPLFAAHAKARRESAIAEYDELNAGEHQSGHHARVLESFMVEDDVVDHLERNNQ
ncbi:MAG: hypothetical protein UE141_05575 [Collinsella sp.]|nr:hypothetical protein [Collinsella sp.]